MACVASPELYATWVYPILAAGHRCLSHRNAIGALPHSWRNAVQAQVRRPRVRRGSAAERYRRCSASRRTPFGRRRSGQPRRWSTVQLRDVMSGLRVWSATAAMARPKCWDGWWTGGKSSRTRNQVRAQGRDLLAQRLRLRPRSRLLCLLGREGASHASPHVLFAASDAN